MTKQQYIRTWAHINEHGMTEELQGVTYQQAAQRVQDGCLECYYDQARETLREIYQETEEQAAKYTNEQVWSQYKHVIALTSQHPKYMTV